MFPISIDTDKIVQSSAQPVSHPFVSSQQRSLNGGKLAISVDRIDYSKCPDNRIKAFDHLWAEQPRCISLLQIATPSRSSIKIYQDLQTSVENLVRDVNGRHGADDWIPIRDKREGFSQSVLAALYRIAKVGVVTPYRDGMNLVAKEYIAAQDPNDPGVLGFVEICRRGQRARRSTPCRSNRLGGYVACDFDSDIDAAGRALLTLESDDGTPAQLHHPTLVLRVRSGAGEHPGRENGWEGHYARSGHAQWCGTDIRQCLG
ncbi:hypothetical protein ACVWXO_000541 [Bradyrhizobium sp. LM2.7]